MSLEQARKKALTLSNQVQDGKNAQVIKGEFRQVEIFAEVAHLYIEKDASWEKAPWKKCQRKIELRERREDLWNELQPRSSEPW